MISAFGVEHGDEVSKAFGTKLATSKLGMGVRNSKLGRGMRNRQSASGTDQGADHVFRSGHVGGYNAGRNAPMVQSREYKLSRQESIKSRTNNGAPRLF